MTAGLLTALRHRLQNLTTGDDLKARLIRGGLGSASIEAVNRILSLGLGIVLARSLGAEGYGVYAYAFAMMTLVMVIAEAGVPKLLMREVARSQAREEWGLLRGILRRAAQLVIMVAGAASLAGVLVLCLIGNSLSQTMLYTMALMLLVMPFVAGTNTAAHALRGLNQVILSQALEKLLRPFLVLVSIGTVFLIWPDLREPHYVMAAQLLGAAFVLVTSLLMLRRLTPAEARTSPPAYRSGEWLRSAVPFTLIGGAGIINNHTDIIMLGWFAGSEDVGIYRVAVQGATLVAFSLQVANTVIAPQFSRFYAQGDIARLQRLVTKSARIILLAALPVALAFIFSGGGLASLVFGAEFAAAHAPLAILALGQLINAAFGSVGFLLNMTGHEFIVARILWQTALLNVVLNAVLIPHYGMIGAAIATAISLVVWNALLYRQVRDRLGIVSTAFRLRQA